MNPILDLLPLITSVLALCFLLRARHRSYFFDTGFFMAVANIGFVILQTRYLISDTLRQPASGFEIFTLIFVMALGIGIASYLVPKDELDISPMRLFASRFLLFLLYLTSWMIVTMILQPWHLIQTTSALGMTAYYFTYDTWYLIISTGLLVLFILFPVQSFYAKARIVTDRKASNSMKIISVCWALFGVSTFVGSYLAQFDPVTLQSSVAMLDSGLFLLIALALREPTVLARIITPRGYVSTFNTTTGMSPSSSSREEKFSMRLNFRHENLKGHRILLEYEPLATYERLIQDFVQEFQTQGDLVAIFTSVGSPIYRIVVSEANLRIFGFSTKTSNPAKISEQIVLLPERDASLLLDALDKLVKASSGHRLAVVFDVFTDMILSQGFEKVYSPLSSVVELAESPDITTMFLINETAMEKRALNGVRGLFRFQLRYDITGLEKIVESPSAQQQATVNASKIFEPEPMPLEFGGKEEVEL